MWMMGMELVLCRSSKCSFLLSRLSRPSSFLFYACMEVELVNLNAKMNVEGALSTSTLA